MKSSRSVRTNASGSIAVIAATNRTGSAFDGLIFARIFFPLECGPDQLPPCGRRRTSLSGQFLFGKVQRLGTPDPHDSRTPSTGSWHDWPGIPRAENAIERAVALGFGPILHVGDLPSNLQYTSAEKLPDADELVPWKPWSGARFSARSAKRPGTSWPPRVCSHRKPRCMEAKQYEWGGRRRERGGRGDETGGDHL